MPGSKKSSAKSRQTIIDKLFGGDEQAYKEHMRKIGASGGRKSKRTK